MSLQPEPAKLSPLQRRDSMCVALANQRLGRYATTALELAFLIGNGIHFSRIKLNIIIIIIITLASGVDGTCPPISKH